MKTKILLLTALIFSSVFTIAQIINVPANQPTIQAGIDAAGTGDTVLVDSGTYLENIKFNGKAITVSSNFILSGDTNDINNTIIDGSQPAFSDSAATVMFVNSEDTNSIIMGFTITGGSGMQMPNIWGPWQGGGGIACIEAGAKILHNKISGNEITDTIKAGGGGIACFSVTGDQWVIIENNIISNDSVNAPDNAFGAGVYSNINTVIRNNVIEYNYCLSNSLVEGGGFMVQELPGTAVQVSINNNVIQNN